MAVEARMGNRESVRARMKPKTQGALGRIEIEVDKDGTQQWKSIYDADHFQLAKQHLMVTVNWPR